MFTNCNNLLKERSIKYETKVKYMLKPKVIFSLFLDENNKLETQLFVFYIKLLEIKRKDLISV